MLANPAGPYNLIMIGAAAIEYRALLPAALLAEPDRKAATGRVRRSLRDWLVDILAFLLAIGAGISSLVEASARDVPQPVLVVDAALGGLGCLGVWLRRRWPVGFAVAVSVISVYSESAFSPAMVALFTVAVHRRFAVLAAVTGGFLGCQFVFGLLRPDSPTDPGTAVFGMSIIAAVVAWGMFVRARRQLVLSLRERARRAEAERDLRVGQARQAERARIAREMHDVLAHRISLLSLHAGALEYRPDAPAEEVARAAGVIRSTAHQVLDDLREVIGVLRAGAADDQPDRPQPTLADLPELIDESRQAGMRVRLDQRVADLAAVPAGIGRSAYRIVQEGLTNARKHAEGATVDVTVEGAAGSGLTLEIRNPCPPGTAAGTAGDTASGARIPGAGTGLIGLAERASLAGGWLEHGRTASDEFRLRAWLPWP
jgi:signal transduction histidine kinase